MTPPRRFFRPAWAEVDLSLLRANIRRFKRLAARRAKTLFVVKANAYGHGALACAKAAEPLVDWLGVSSVEEGIALREAAIRRPVLVLGSLYPFESFLAAAEFGLVPTVASYESARRLVESAKRIKRPVSCHVKIDTGMNRIGVRAEEGLRVIEFLASQKPSLIGGVYTHFSCADSDAAFTGRQLAAFRGALAAIARRGLRCGLRHAANSAGALEFPQSRLDMVRPGIALYGVYPGFKPIFSLKTKVIFIKNVPKGGAIGYGAAYKTKRPSRIATIPMGYADGLARRLSNRGEVLVCGRRCRIVGRISMDMTTIDVTAVPQARVGEDVVVLGAQGKEEITARQLAGLLGTIPYEVLCSVSARVPRVYLR